LGHELKSKLPDPELLLSLAPEELSGVLLPIFQQRSRGGVSFNLYNYLNEFHQREEIYARAYIDRITNAVNEAVTWMLASGLISRDYHQTNMVFVTRRGMLLLTSDQFRDFRQASRLSAEFLHPSIADKAWPTFIRRNYDTAVFEAFKEVEIAVRSAGKFDAREMGVPLMRAAFHPTNGPLTNMTQPMAEREALMALFAGAIGSYKNPSSHRTVQISDPVEAGEMLTLASHLMRIVEDRASSRLNTNP
jgi:uncharacterized protein (TIGR02391 family)